MPKKETFLSRNLVAVVMVPSLIGLHYCWSLMQRNRTLVSAEEEIELPVVTFAKYCWRQLQGGSNAVTNEVTPTVSAAKVVPAK